MQGVGFSVYTAEYVSILENRDILLCISGMPNYASLHKYTTIIPPNVIYLGTFPNNNITVTDNYTVLQSLGAAR